MDAEKNKRQTMYISGSTARKLNTVPDDYTDDYKKKKPDISIATKRNRDKALSIDLKFMVFLTGAIAITLYVCIGFISVQSNVSNNTKKVSSLEKKLNNLKDENDAMLIKLNSSIDLDNIYKVAVEELDMVYANKDQVILYSSIESDYVRQYQDIPETDKNSILNILDMFLDEYPKVR